MTSVTFTKLITRNRLLVRYGLIWFMGWWICFYIDLASRSQRCIATASKRDGRRSQHRARWEGKVESVSEYCYYRVWVVVVVLASRWQWCVTTASKRDGGRNQHRARWEGKVESAREYSYRVWVVFVVLASSSQRCVTIYQDIQARWKEEPT